jgi:hypothetical protein
VRSVSLSIVLLAAILIAGLSALARRSAELLVINGTSTLLSGLTIELHRDGAKEVIMLPELPPGSSTSIEYKTQGEGVGVVISRTDSSGAKRVIRSEYIISGTREVTIGK